MPKHEEPKSTSTILEALGNSNAGHLNAFPKQESAMEGVFNPGHSFEDRSDISKIIEKNPTHRNRLISLSKALQDNHIEPWTVDHSSSDNLVTHASAMVSLLEFLQHYQFDKQFITLNGLLNASPYKEVFRQGVRTLATKGDIGSSSLQLMFDFPEYAPWIANLIINFQDRGLPVIGLTEVLSQFPRSKVGGAVSLLTFLLEKDVFYPKILNTLLKHEKYIDLIYEGAKLLAQNHHLLVEYSEKIQHHPSNAKITAKVMLLLNNESILKGTRKKAGFDYTQFGLGTYFFLSHLKHAHMLDEHNYKIICHQYRTLEKNDIIDAFHQMPLFSFLGEDTLKQILKCLDSNAESSEVVELIRIPGSTPSL